MSTSNNKEAIIFRLLFALDFANRNEDEKFCLTCLENVESGGDLDDPLGYLVYLAVSMKMSYKPDGERLRRWAKKRIS